MCGAKPLSRASRIRLSVRTRERVSTLNYNIEEEIGSGIEVKYNDFKAAIKKFTKRVEVYKEEVEVKKKTI